MLMVITFKRLLLLKEQNQSKKIKHPQNQRNKDKIYLELCSVFIMLMVINIKNNKISINASSTLLSQMLFKTFLSVSNNFHFHHRK